MDQKDIVAMVVSRPEGSVDRIKRRRSVRVNGSGENMNKIMSSFFNNDVLEDSESISENEDSHEEAAPRKRKGACQTDAGSKASNEHIKDNGCLISPYSKKDD